MSGVPCHVSGDNRARGRDVHFGSRLTATRLRPALKDHYPQRFLGHGHARPRKRTGLVTDVRVAKPNQGSRWSHRARGRERGSVREDLALSLLGILLIGLAFLIG
jgi:hypothetical protein